jgi:hypothetical protein
MKRPVRNLIAGLTFKAKTVGLLKTSAQGSFKDAQGNALGVRGDCDESAVSRKKKAQLRG